VKFDVLKIDVEGAEVDLLNGAKKTLLTTREIIMEYHSLQLFDECKAILASYGFKCEKIKANRLNYKWFIGYLLLNKRLLLHGLNLDFVARLVNKLKQKPVREVGIMHAQKITLS
jgi:hypothetical protein